MYFLGLALNYNLKVFLSNAYFYKTLLFQRKTTFLKRRFSNVVFQTSFFKRRFSNLVLQTWFS